MTYYIDTDKYIDNSMVCLHKLNFKCPSYLEDVECRRHILPDTQLLHSNKT
jgi:hypothetical protein